MSAVVAAALNEYMAGQGADDAVEADAVVDAVIKSAGVGKLSATDLQ